ncbi:MAG: hypothetical protein ALECFALPRED_000778 [Alectoria fallacina]|uniref:Uncharacterized protein n=1 Tax=Alectoria fallacina TaxID=1903189 RepID=A0A8H3F5R1_9LECA|nr:MAG: hypothetical protein ALECFALPRED_000778 [Alectoria fallacina]
MVSNTSDLASFKCDCINSLVDFIDNVLAEKDWLLIRGHIDTIQKANYRMDRQGDLLKKPERYHPALKGLTRSKGEGGGSFGKSQPTLAQVEIECGSCITVEKLKEAFYASMIPQKKYLRLGYLHRVVVHKDGTFDVTVNAKWKKAEEGL